MPAPSGRARSVLVVALALAFLATAQAPAVLAAGRCGDDVDGLRVPCACGDIVVSDTTLRPEDPVVSRPCPIDGLLVAAGPVAEQISLDLGGQVLRGSGTGTGIRVDAGGADGAVIVGGTAGARATISGFATGVIASRGDVLRRIERVTVVASRRDGISLGTNGTLLVDVEASDNARDGVRQSGRGGRIVGVVARRNGDTGVRVTGGGTQVAGRCEDNRNHGLVGEGPGIDVNGLVTRGNGGRGAMVQGMRSRVRGLVSEANLLPDILPARGES